MLQVIANNQHHQVVSIVSGHNGLDEISTTCPSFLWQYQKPNILPCQTIHPQKLGFDLVHHLEHKSLVHPQKRKKHLVIIELI